LTQEGTVPTGLSTSAEDNCYADSTQHGLLCNFNAGTTLPLLQGPASDTTNTLAKFSGTNGGKVVGSTITDNGTDVSTTEPLISPTHNPCPDTSGSGTAQVCNTPVTFSVVTGSCFTYTTTTTNSGTGLTVNINSLGAKSVAIPGLSGFTTTLTAGIIPANKPQLLCYDGTNLDDMQTGTVSASGGSGAYTLMGNNSVSYAVSPEYITFPGNVAGATTQPQTAASIMSTAQTIDTLYVYLNVATAASSSVTYTLYYGATASTTPTATSLTCTIGAAAQSCSDLTHSFTTVAGSIIAVQITYTGTPGSTGGNTLSVRAH
jgi:hypothetical protein